jgi:group I intron endonuclease
MLDTLVEHKEHVGTYDDFCAAYVLTHRSTGHKYIGSSGKVGYRLCQHRSALKHNKHPCVKLQEAYNLDAGYDAVIYGVATRELAFQLEQALLDRYKETGLLFNRSSSALAPSTGYEVTDEFREKCRHNRLGHTNSEIHRERISKALTGQKMVMTARRKAMYAARKGVPVSEERHAQLKVAQDHRKTCVSMDGIEYLGIREASRQTGIDDSMIRFRCKSNNPKFKDWFFVT